MELKIKSVEPVYPFSNCVSYNPNNQTYGYKQPGEFLHTVYTVPQLKDLLHEMEDSLFLLQSILEDARSRGLV